MRNEEVLLAVKEQRNILHEMRKRKANWIGHILCRNCLLQQVIEVKVRGGIEVTGRRGIRRSKLLDDLEERKGYTHLKEEALDSTVWRAGFGRGFGPDVRQTAKSMSVSQIPQVTLSNLKVLPQHKRNILCPKNCYKTVLSSIHQ
jgi:hypothetical protein